MQLIMGTMRIPEGALEVARPAMAAMLAASRAEDGCLAYNYAQDVLDPRIIHISERWRDRAALDAHFRTPHMAEWRAQFGAIGITDRDLQLYESDDGQPI
ncbi:antibiotic biosynthesis monooxygenase [Sphingomonas panacisoli]|uniref:Antibiotic biosynthesis monooxygenase n=2 Tax=Sphingomonas panacisoli TaxID=1813879 RepID=A0A5B8LGV8_9SPHN|nr:antibiotic biosynthesis monooxygenase [Sphingomonas panacisoli]